MSSPDEHTQINEMSRAIGRIDSYVHEFRHGTNNVSTKVDALELNSAKRHDNLKIEVTSKIDAAVSAMRAEIAAVAARVALLEADKHRRDGAYSAFDWLRLWGPALFSLVVVLYLGGRAAGFIPSPPVTPSRVEATIHPGQRRIEGTVGGKPQ